MPCRHACVRSASSWTLRLRSRDYGADEFFGVAIGTTSGTRSTTRRGGSARLPRSTGSSRSRSRCRRGAEPCRRNHGQTDRRGQTPTGDWWRAAPHPFPVRVGLCQSVCPWLRHGGSGRGGGLRASASCFVNFVFAEGVGLAASAPWGVPRRDPTWRGETPRIRWGRASGLCYNGRDENSRPCMRSVLRAVRRRGRDAADVTDDDGRQAARDVTATDQLTLRMKVGGGAYAVFTRKD